MEHIFTNTDTMTSDCAKSLAAIYPDRFQIIQDSYNGRAILRKPLHPERVNIIVSGGGGGYPLTAGYVADGLADASVNGNHCTAPSAYDIYETAKALGSEKGYLLIYNNFMGDCLNNDLAAELLTLEGIPALLCPCNDDSLSASASQPRSERTGLTGFLYLLKIGAACAAKGLSLEETYNIVQHANRRINSVSLTMNFNQKQLCLGAGFSGEPPVIIYDNRFSMKDAAEIIYEHLLKDLKPSANDRLHLLVSRMEKTRCEEAFILAKAINDYSASHHKISKINVGYHSSIMEDHGFFVTILCEDEILRPYTAGTVNTGSFVL